MRVDQLAEATKLAADYEAAKDALRRVKRSDKVSVEGRFETNADTLHLGNLFSILGMSKRDVEAATRAFAASACDARLEVLERRLRGMGVDVHAHPGEAPTPKPGE